MPRLVHASRRVVVYDDFLPADELEALYARAEAVDYELVHQKRIQKVWRPHDGAAMRGPGAQLTDEGLVFPGGERFDVPDFFARVLGALPQIEPLVGVRGKDWVQVSAAPWVHPAGSALSLHFDGQSYTGAYTFYLHRTWKIHWGGLLLVMNHDDEPRRERARGGPPAPTPWFEDGPECAALLDDVALCIHPKPNRIVFLAGGTPHMVTRVDPNAGQNLRIAVAGFFQRSTLSLASKLVRAGGGASLSVRVVGGDAELVRGADEVVARIDAWGADALRLVADRRELVVRDLPDALADEDKIALSRALIRARVLAAAE